MEYVWVLLLIILVPIAVMAMASMEQQDNQEIRKIVAKDDLEVQSIERYHFNFDSPFILYNSRSDRLYRVVIKDKKGALWFRFSLFSTDKRWGN